MANSFFSLTLVGGPHIEYMGLDWLVQHHRTGGRANEWHAVFVEEGQDGLGMGGATGQKHGEHLAILNQLAGIFAGQLGVELVVQGHQFNLFSLDATLGIDCVNIEFCACGGFLYASAHRAAKASGLPHQDLCMACVRKRHKGKRRAPCVGLFHVLSPG